MAITYVFAGIPVADLAAALDWYERLFGRPPDLVPNDNEGAWELAGTDGLYVVGDPERAGKALVTLLVDDLDDLVARLAERGLGAPELQTIPGAVRKAIFHDPEGNRITFGQPVS